jgi:hypothetical protein
VLLLAEQCLEVGDRGCDDSGFAVPVGIEAGSLNRRSGARTARHHDKHGQ